MPYYGIKRVDDEGKNFIWTKEGWQEEAEARGFELFCTAEHAGCIIDNEDMFQIAETEEIVIFRCFD